MFSERDGKIVVASAVVIVLNKGGLLRNKNTETKTIGRCVRENSLTWFGQYILKNRTTVDPAFQKGFPGVIPIARI